jgi:hypothetical protein
MLYSTALYMADVLFFIASWMTVHLAMVVADLSLILVPWWGISLEGTGLQLRAGIFNKSMGAIGSEEE